MIDEINTSLEQSVTFEVVGEGTTVLMYLPQKQTDDILRMKEQSIGKTIDFVTKDTLDVILRKYNLIE